MSLHTLHTYGPLPGQTLCVGHTLYFTVATTTGMSAQTLPSRERLCGSLFRPSVSWQRPCLLCNLLRVQIHGSVLLLATLAPGQGCLRLRLHCSQEQIWGRGNSVFTLSVCRPTLGMAKKVPFETTLMGAWSFFIQVWDTFSKPPPTPRKTATLFTKDCHWRGRSYEERGTHTNVTQGCGPVISESSSFPSAVVSKIQALSHLYPCSLLTWKTNTQPWPGLNFELKKCRATHLVNW